VITKRVWEGAELSDCPIMKYYEPQYLAVGKVIVRIVCHSNNQFDIEWQDMYECEIYNPGRKAEDA